MRRERTRCVRSGVGKGNCRSARKEVGAGEAVLSAPSSKAEFRIEFGVTQVLRVEFPIEWEQQGEGDELRAIIFFVHRVASFVILAVVYCESIEFEFAECIAQSIEREGAAQVTTRGAAQVAPRVPTGFSTQITAGVSSGVATEVAAQEPTECTAQVAAEHAAASEYAAEESPCPNEDPACEFATHAGASELVESHACGAEPSAGSGEDDAPASSCE